MRIERFCKLFDKTYVESNSHESYSNPANDPRKQLIGDTPEGRAWAWEVAEIVTRNLVLKTKAEGLYVPA